MLAKRGSGRPGVRVVQGLLAARSVGVVRCWGSGGVVFLSVVCSPKCSAIRGVLSWRCWLRLGWYVAEVVCWVRGELVC